MNKANFRIYMDLQIEAIKKYKRLQNQKAGRDLGQSAVYEWIDKEAEKFSKMYGWLLEDIRYDGN